MMEPSCSRFTPAEGGARLANTSREKNLLVADHTTFIALRLLHEEAYSIRGTLFDGKKRSVYITRASRVTCTAYDIGILTDLSVVSAINYEDVFDWMAELDKKEVAVCTSAVLRRIFEKELLSIANINVMIIDSCHLICKDDDLRYIMRLYKSTNNTDRPRILALTYPLFGPKNEEPPNETETCNNDNDNSKTVNDNSKTENDNSKNENDNSKTENDISKSENDISERKNDEGNSEIVKEKNVIDNVDGKIDLDVSISNKKSIDIKNTYDTDIKTNINDNLIKAEIVPDISKETDKTVQSENLTEQSKNDTLNTKTNTDTIKSDTDTSGNENDVMRKQDFSLGAYENLDDFDMYEKLEWKIDELEHELCCEADLAEDIDGVKRLSPAIAKPRELIVEFSEQKDRSLLPKTYVEMEQYMKACIDDVMQFLDDHRYDPMEIYGEDLYDELIKIPDPTLDPKQIMHQFLYVLDQLGPYAADKAAFSLLIKLEKLRIKVPYERHFLLLCICTTVFVKIRCYTDLVFSEIENDWDKIRQFSTPKLLRFVEILAKFKPASDLSNKSDNDTANLKSENDISTIDISENENKNSSDTFVSTNEMLNAIESCDFVSLGNEIENIINVHEANLKEIPDLDTITDASQTHTISSNITKTIPRSSTKIENKNTKCDNDLVRNENDYNKNENYPIDANQSENDTNRNETDKKQSKPNPSDDTSKSDTYTQNKTVLGFVRRHGHRVRGRGRILRSNAMKLQQNQQNPDALCGIVFIKEPFMAKILFNLIVDLSRSHPSLGFLSAQYTAIERIPDPVKEPRDFETQRKKQEDVLKKFRMHECNLLLATAILEEGIDLPRCNLVLRWDVPTCYRSHGLCKSRGRAPRAACVLMSHAGGQTTTSLVHNVATYTEIDQIITRKCGCGVQNEPDQSEEDYADVFTPFVQAYQTIKPNDKVKSENDKTESDNDVKCSDIQNSSGINQHQCISKNETDANKSDEVISLNESMQKQNDIKDSRNSVKIDIEKSDIDIPTRSDDTTVSENDKVSSENENNGASVDLGSAIALINRYCGKLPSDTFTRLAPQWWMEKVSLPYRYDPQKLMDAFICTLRLPLNCPVKFNIVGHPMPTRVLARRMVALQAARILHKSGELDDNLMPISKENFQSIELNIGGFPRCQAKDNVDPNDIARPGTTKRRQYYYKKTARAFTDCEPQINATDEEILKPFDPSVLTDSASGSTNSLCAISCVLQCALPERYNTRGRKLHAPQNAAQALALLVHTKADTHRMQIPQFPVYTRSGEVRVSLKRVPDADTRLSPHRQTRILRFMRFVFSEVLRVRRKGMKLDPKGCTHNNYYVVPTIKTTKEDGSSKIDIDWDFLEVIYNYTEEKQKNNFGKPTSWQEDDDYDLDMDFSKSENETKCQSENDTNQCHNENDTKNFDSCDVETDGSNADQKGSNKKEKITSQMNQCDIKLKQNPVGRYSDDKNLEIRSNNEITIENKNHNNILKLKNDDITWNEKAQSQSDIVKCQSDRVEHQNENDKYHNGDNKKVLKKMVNPFLSPGEVFVFDPEKYKEAVVTPWYRNQDQPQFFLVAEICWSLTPDSGFPSATHTTFRHYYESKYGVELTQANQPLLDVDHTSARLNLLTPRYVNRKGVALPVSSERTRRAKRDRLDQKQILLPELCHTHPFPAPLWFATVALPAILYRVNALLIADEIRESVAREAGLGVAKLTDPDFQWPPLHFGWSLSEVLNADTEKIESNRAESEKKDDSELQIHGKEKSELMDKDADSQQATKAEESKKETDSHLEMKPEGEKGTTIDDTLQDKEDAESGFEIGMWSNEMASAITQDIEYDGLMEDLPPNLTLCSSASGGTNWCGPVDEKKSNFNSGKAFSMADSDCSYMSSDFDTDDSDLNSVQSDDETESSGFGSTRLSNALGVRIEYKTAHEAEAVELFRKSEVSLCPRPSERDDYSDRCERERYLRDGIVPLQYKEKFHTAIKKHEEEIKRNCIVKESDDITAILPESPTRSQNKISKENEPKNTLLDQLFPYGTDQTQEQQDPNEITLENLEKSKKTLLADLKKTLPENEVKKMNCFSMIDVTDAPVKLSNKDFQQTDKENFKGDNSVNNEGSIDTNQLDEVKDSSSDFKPYYQDDCGFNGKAFDFDFQPNLDGHPGPSPSLILQALTMSNANDGINLERLETIGDSFLKLAITTRLYCAHPTVHEGKLSHMRSKQVSNLNLYRLGRNKKLGTLMIATKFEPHDNWLPPCHKAPNAADFTSQVDSQEKLNKTGASVSNDGCFIPYNLITQHSIPDKSIADCVEALIGAYLLACGPRGALLFMCWLGLSVLPAQGDEQIQKLAGTVTKQKQTQSSNSDTDCDSDGSDDEGLEHNDGDENCTTYKRPIYGELKPPPSPLLRYIADPEGELEKMLSGYEVLEETLQYRFRDRSLLLQAMTHASHQTNRLTDCYQRLEFLGDAILDYLITRHLFTDPRRHSPGALTDLRSALVNNTIFATLAVRHHFHKFFRHMSPGLNEVLTKYVKIQEENGHSISEEHYLIQEDEMEQAEDVEVPKALGDLFESVAGAIFLDSGMSLSAVWRSYERLMRNELEAFSAAAPKSPVRELLEQEPDTAKFGKPERLADGRRVRVKVEVFGRGTFKGIGRNYRIAKGTAARCALRHLKTYNNR